MAEKLNLWFAELAFGSIGSKACRSQLVKNGINMLQMFGKG
jgi:hypothetical protein